MCLDTLTTTTTDFASSLPSQLSTHSQGLSLGLITSSSNHQGMRGCTALAVEQQGRADLSEGLRTSCDLVSLFVGVDLEKTHLYQEEGTHG